MCEKDEVKAPVTRDSNPDGPIEMENVDTRNAGPSNKPDINREIDQNPREDFNLTSDGEFNGMKSLVLGRVHDQSGSVGSDQPLVNAMRTDSALIGALALWSSNRDLYVAFPLPGPLLMTQNHFISLSFTEAR
ncbi:Contactin-associated protein-like 4 [Dissostichus eleginoides]|uniref:Contactin-associated protein-like 4 n=1 Tax=Dissostichus eleginoides TaxID=100907 RepID=A0AAD9B8B9_DISEL|nr:Contactin-associated protein-like 4 [Dissostichus eleginoides]